MTEQNQAQNQPRGQEKKPPVKVEVALECSEPQKTDTGFLIRACAIITQGERALEEKTARFFVDFGVEKPEEKESDTDNTGRAYAQFLIPFGKETATVEVQMLHSNSRSQKQTIVLPKVKPKEEPKPAFLIVDPRRIGNKINIFIRVADEENRGVKNAKITVVDDGELIPKPADENGELLYKFELEPDQEKEIMICVSGYGQKEFRRTFKGRSETK